MLWRTWPQNPTHNYFAPRTRLSTKFDSDDTIHDSEHRRLTTVFIQVQLIVKPLSTVLHSRGRIGIWAPLTFLIRKSYVALEITLLKLQHSNRTCVRGTVDYVNWPRSNARWMQVRTGIIPGTGTVVYAHGTWELYMVNLCESSGRGGSDGRWEPPQNICSAK